MDWELLYSGFTAFGTVGAVFISLWFTLRKKQRFLIKKITVSMRRNADKTEENYLHILFENLIEVPMEIHGIEVVFIIDKNHKTMVRWKLEDEFVASLSHYELKCPLTRDFISSYLKTAESIKLNIKSSFGNKTIKIPKNEKEQLCNSLGSGGEWKK